MTKITYHEGPEARKRDLTKVYTQVMKEPEYIEGPKVCVKDIIALVWGVARPDPSTALATPHPAPPCTIGSDASIAPSPSACRRAARSCCTAPSQSQLRRYTSTPTAVAESHTSWESGGWQWLLQKHWMRVSLGRDWKFPNILASSR